MHRSDNRIPIPTFRGILIITIENTREILYQKFISYVKHVIPIKEQEFY